MESGADCGPVNPLQNMMKQFNADKSHQRDQFRPEFEQAGPSTRPGRQMGMHDQQLVDEFFKQEMGGPRPQEPFQFREMRGQLDHMMPPDLHARPDDWGQEFHQMQGGPRISEDPEMVRAFEEAFHKQQQGGWEGEFLAQPQNQMPMPEDFREFEAVYAQHGGKTDFGHLSEQDWAQQFSAVEQVMDKGKGPVNWEDEFAKTEGLEDQEFVDRFNEAWKASAGEFDDLSGAATSGTKSWEDDYDDYLNGSGANLIDPDPFTAPLQPYHFEKENPFLNHENPLEEGLRLWNEGGQLSAAALCFEAAVQREETSSRGWMYLGQVQAENEKEEPAIAALQRAVKEAPDNLPALMSLAVSYTNEGQDLQAYSTLSRWLSTRYPDIFAENPLPPEAARTLSPQEFHNRVTQMFLNSARRATTVDADVQVGLGVLFYNSGDFDKAVDCFTAALSARPGDYVLWNRLGATLANSGRSEEAIDAYYKALEIKPTFVRGRYNLGVSCINIGVYKEAAEHLLGALSLHVVGGSGNGSDAGHANVSQNLWETLRRTFILMERRDLADLAHSGTPLDTFRGHDFEF